MASLRFDPEFLSALKALGPQPEHVPSQDVYQVRDSMNQVLQASVGGAPRPENVQEKVFTVTSRDGTEIQVTRFATPEVMGASEPTPAVVYAHGGGMVAGSAAVFSSKVATFAHASNLPFFSVEYRLAPEHRAPCAVEDMYASLKYVSGHAAELNIDATKIAVMGDSAGGGLAAATALLARDQEFSPPIAKQILVYPMLDDRTELSAEDPLQKFLFWANGDNILAWSAYVGEDKRGKADGVSPYAAPARAESLRGLPPAYIEVGSLDLFRDEDISYATRLAKDEVEIEFHLLPGLPHGFDGFRSVSWTDRSYKNRIDALKRIGM